MEKIKKQVLIVGGTMHRVPADEAEKVLSVLLHSMRKVNSLQPSA